MSHPDTAWTGALYSRNAFRIWHFDTQGKVLTSTTAPGHSSQDLADALTSSGPTPTRPVISAGLNEGGYRDTPCTPLPETLRPAPHAAFQHAPIPGLAQPSPVHVARGAETAIAGFLALNPDFDGTLCLPGEITTWAQISADEIVSFQTFLSTEIAHDQAANLGLSTSDHDSATFTEALNDTLSSPERLTARLASLRAEGLRNNLSQTQARARLWGALIGAELAATRAFWLGQNIAVIGDAPLAGLYIDALGAQGALPTQADHEAMVIKGLSAAYKRLRG